MPFVVRTLVLAVCSDKQVGLCDTKEPAEQNLFYGFSKVLAVRAIILESRLPAALKVFHKAAPGRSVTETRPRTDQITDCIRFHPGICTCWDNQADFDPAYMEDIKPAHLLNRSF